MSNRAKQILRLFLTVALLNGCGRDASEENLESKPAVRQQIDVSQVGKCYITVHGSACSTIPAESEYIDLSGNLTYPNNCYARAQLIYSWCRNVGSQTTGVTARAERGSTPYTYRSGDGFPDLYVENLVTTGITGIYPHGMPGNFHGPDSYFGSVRIRIVNLGTAPAYGSIGYGLQLVSNQNLSNLGRSGEVQNTFIPPGGAIFSEVHFPMSWPGNSLYDNYARATVNLNPSGVVIESNPSNNSRTFTNLNFSNQTIPNPVLIATDLPGARVRLSWISHYMGGAVYLTKSRGGVTYASLELPLGNGYRDYDRYQVNGFDFQAYVKPLPQILPNHQLLSNVAAFSSLPVEPPQTAEDVGAVSGLAFALETTRLPEHQDVIRQTLTFQYLSAHTDRTFDVEYRASDNSWIRALTVSEPVAGSTTSYSTTLLTACQGRREIRVIPKVMGVAGIPSVIQERQYNCLNNNSLPMVLNGQAFTSYIDNSSDRKIGRYHLRWPAIAGEGIFYELDIPNPLSAGAATTTVPRNSFTSQAECPASGQVRTFRVRARQIVSFEHGVTVPKTGPYGSIYWSCNLQLPVVSNFVMQTPQFHPDATATVPLSWDRATVLSRPVYKVEKSITQALGSWETLYEGEANAISPTIACNSHQVYLRVSLRYGAASGPVSPVQTVRCATPAVQGLTVSTELAPIAFGGYRNTRVTLSWNPVNFQNALYLPQRSDDGVQWSWASELGNGFTTGATLSGNLTCVQDYWVRILTTGDNSPGTPSNALRVPCRTTDVTYLGLFGFGAQSTSVSLTWMDQAGEDSYQILRSQDQQNWTLVGTRSQDVNTFQDTGLQPATTYYYRVIAMNEHGGGESQMAILTVRTADPIAVPLTISASAQPSYREVE